MHTLFRKLTGQPCQVESALWYAQTRHWDVYPGAWRKRGEHASCSCPRAACPAAGAHPQDEEWRADATTAARTIRWWWGMRPEASIVLPTGRTFDVIEVPAAVGRVAMERILRLGLRLGPVLGDRQRHRFLVVPGIREELPDLLSWLGWPHSDRLDLRCYAEGDYVTAPPMGLTTRSRTHWVVEPTLDNRLLPYGRDIIPTITYASLQLAEQAAQLAQAARQQRPTTPSVAGRRPSRPPRPVARRAAVPAQRTASRPEGGPG